MSSKHIKHVKHVYALFLGHSFHNLHDLHFKITYILICMGKEHGHKDFRKHKATQKLTRDSQNKKVIQKCDVIIQVRHV